MQRLLRIYGILLWLVFSALATYAQPAESNAPTAQPTKEEIEFWKKKAKEYQSKPLRLKQEFDNYRDQVMDLKKRNKELLDLNASLNARVQQLQTELAARPSTSVSQPVAVATPPAAIHTPVTPTPTTTTTPPATVASTSTTTPSQPGKSNTPSGPSPAEAELRNSLAGANATLASNVKKIDSLRWENVQLRGSLSDLEVNYKKATLALQTSKKNGENGITKAGLTYRVQIGAFVLHEVKSDNTLNPDEFMAERSDGFNKYIVGSCRTYEEAVKFKEELRKIGVKDAWIAPYIDSVRVTMQEASEYLKQQGQPRPTTSGVTPAPNGSQKPKPAGTPAPK